MPNTFERRFQELCQQADNLEGSKRRERTAMGEGDYIDANEFLKWRVQVRHLIFAVCGTESEHFKLLDQVDKPTFVGETNYTVFRKLKAVLLAAKEDYEGGYLRKIRNLIQADVFDSELEQADELLASGYKIPAAVIAGIVLETSLRQTCQDRGLATGKLDKMNADLAKAGVYNKLLQKQITALADIRNNAAHGHSNQFNEGDVTNMIRDVRNLVASWLS
jgi:hypothetical protein